MPHKHSSKQTGVQQAIPHLFPVETAGAEPWTGILNELVQLADPRF